MHFFGAYWGGRLEGRVGAAERLARFLTDLSAHVDFRSWYEMGLSASVRIAIDWGAADFEARLVGLGDPELGFQFAAWNGAESSLVAALGSDHPRLNNSILLRSNRDAPPDDAECLSVMERMIAVFDPDRCVMSVDDSRVGNRFTYSRGTSIERHGTTVPPARSPGAIDRRVGGARRGEHWVVAALARIRMRPGMWLGSESVRDLDVYLAGYEQARRDLGVDVSDSAVLGAFAEWLRERVDGGRRSSLGWSGLIETLDSSPKNVWTFFRELEAFLNEAREDLAPHREAWNVARLETAEIVAEAVRCPRCEQDWVRDVTLVALGRRACLCVECDALWLSKDDIARDTFLDYGTFMQAQGRVSPDDPSEIQLGEKLIYRRSGD